MGHAQDIFENRTAQHVLKYVPHHEKSLAELQSQSLMHFHCYRTPNDNESRQLDDGVMSKL